MGFSKGMFSSKTDDWATPQQFFNNINKKYNFDVDVCATPVNAKCSRYFTKKQDGLKQKWDGKCWCNPPYGRAIGLWLEKAYKSSVLGAIVICLVPARTDTKWWNNWAVKGDIKFIKGRLKFSDLGKPAAFPSAIIIFKPSITPHWGIFPDIDVTHEINLWGKDRIPMMAPWLL